MKSANFENPYFLAKSKAIGFAFSVKSANFENPQSKSKAIELILKMLILAKKLVLKVHGLWFRLAVTFLSHTPLLLSILRIVNFQNEDASNKKPCNNHILFLINSFQSLHSLIW